MATGMSKISRANVDIFSEEILEASKGFEGTEFAQQWKICSAREYDRSDRLVPLFSSTFMAA